MWSYVVVSGENCVREITVVDCELYHLTESVCMLFFPSPSIRHSTNEHGHQHIRNVTRKLICALTIVRRKNIGYDEKQRHDIMLALSPLAPIHKKCLLHFWTHWLTVSENSKISKLVERIYIEHWYVGLELRLLCDVCSSILLPYNHTYTWYAYMWKIHERRIALICCTVYKQRNVS